MAKGGLKEARELTSKGFHYDNLVTMAGHCSMENQSDKILSAYLLNRVFMQLADELKAGPVMSSELHRLEARYRTAINLALETAIAGAPQDEQNKKCIELIQLLWKTPKRD